MSDPTIRIYYVETPFGQIAAPPLLLILSRPPPF
jgi:hypothetical protein